MPFKPKTFLSTFFTTLLDHLSYLAVQSALLPDSSFVFLPLHTFAKGEIAKAQI